MNSFRLSLSVLIVIYLSGCYPTIYGVPEEFWMTLTEDQKRTTMERYYEQEQLRLFQENTWRLERERRRTEEAEQRAREAEYRAREAEQKLREEREYHRPSFQEPHDPPTHESHSPTRDENQETDQQPSKRLGHGRVTK